jgi:hypothetical protein
VLSELETAVRPDTLLRWYRELIASKWNYCHRRAPGRPRVMPTNHAVGANASRALTPSVVTISCVTQSLRTRVERGAEIVDCVARRVMLRLRLRKGSGHTTL